MKALLTSIFCFCFISLSAQSSFDGTGFSFDVNSSINLNPKYSLKPAVKGRYVSVFRKTDDLENIGVRSRRIDFQLAMERRLKSTTKAAVGAFHRLSDEQNATRIFQQIGWVRKTNSSISFIHRVKFDQTIRSTDDVEFRARFRYGLSLPLQGFKLNNNEKYFLAYAEYLGKMRNSEFTNELRLKLSIGQLLRGDRKLELGFDFRYDSPWDVIQDRLYLINLAYFFITLEKN